MIKKVSYKVISCILVVTMMVVCFQGYSTVSAAKKTTLAKKSISVNVGKKKTIKLKNKSGKSKYTYSSAKKSIAKVTAKGVVTGVKAGTVKITVKETVKKTKKTRKVGIVKVTVKRVDSTLPTATPQLATQMPIVIPGTTTQAPVIIATATPVPTPCVDIDFVNGDISKFTTVGDGVKNELNTDGYNDDACIKATNRSSRNSFPTSFTGCGMGINLSKIVKAATTYKVTCYVRCDTATTMSMKTTTGSFWPNQVGDSVKVKAGEWVELTAILATPDSISNSFVLYWDAENTSNIYMDSLVIQEQSVGDNIFKQTFTDIFGMIGVCNTYTQMRENKLFTTTYYNSVTMENEMKPQSLLVSNNISKTLPAGYVKPDSYKDTTFPVLDFSGVDNAIKTAYEHGFKIRFHVLLWHTQTPTFFFKRNYNEDNSFVTAEYMNGRIDYYVQNVMKHIYSDTDYGPEVVYAVDVMNEYFHNYDKGSKSMWNTIYYPSETSEANRTNKPEYVKRAFQVAHGMLEAYDLEDKVSLFYNDYNTYEVYEDIVTMVNYINDDGIICDGVGMQAHLDVDYPKPGMTGKIATTIDAFTANNFEIQITELDVTDYDNSGNQAQYYYDLIHMLVTKKKQGANITGLTFWGLCDTNSWRRDGKPLLFSAIFAPKDSYHMALKAAQDAWK